MTDAQKLDLILDECKARLSRHHPDGKWEEIAKKVCNDNDAKIDNPVFVLYIKYLISENYIEDDKNNGYIARHKGLNFIGFTKQKRRHTISAFLQSSQTWAIVVGTLGLLIWELVKYHLEHCNICIAK